MKMTMAMKLGSGFGVLLLILIVTGFFIDRNMRRIHQSLRQVATVEEPANAAAYEMEINVIGTGMGVLKYLETGDGRYRRRVEKDAADFARFKARYDRLVETQREKELSAQLGLLYEEYRPLGETLMNQQDVQDARLDRIAEYLQRIDDIIDDGIHPHIDRAAPDGFAKVLAAAKMESDNAEVGSRLWSFLHTKQAAQRDRLLHDATDFASSLTRFQALHLTAPEAQWATALEEVFQQMMSDVHVVRAIADAMQDNMGRFLHLHTQMDHLLDKKIQIFTDRALAAANGRADQLVTNTRNAILTIIMSSLLVGIVAVLTVGYSIVGAVHKLVAGAKEIGSGRLAHRIDIRQRDELGELAAAFNDMAEKRQQAEHALQGAYARVESQVQERTAELARANKQLQLQLQERQRAENALWESKEHYRSLAETSLVGIWRVTPEGYTLYINPAMCAMLEIETAEELADRTHHAFFTAESFETMTREHAKVLQGIKTSYEVELVSTRGRPRHTVVSEAPLFTAAGHLLSVIRIFTDITERKRLEAHLRQSQKLEAIGTLAGGIAHDFSNFLTVIQTYVYRALRDVPPDSSTWRLLQAIHTAGTRAAELVQQILTFSRQYEPERKPVQLHLVVAEALKLLRAVLPTTVDIQPHMAASGTVLADPTQIYQVLLNLGSNAEYAMRGRGGVLTVRVEEVDVTAEFAAAHPPLHAGPHLRLTVRDTGPGMEREVLERLFEPFFTTKGPGEGTGMGLAVVHGIVTSHSGAITVESTPGQGTTFAIYLPRLDRAVEDEAATQTPPPTGSERILFVDDTAEIAHIGREVLESLGYDVLACTSGVEALEVFRAAPERFDLVMTDQVMPNLTGDVLAREMLRIRPGLPIILFTGLHHSMTEEEARALGIRAFVRKPFVVHDLGQTIRRVLDQPPSVPDGKLSP